MDSCFKSRQKKAGRLPGTSTSFFYQNQLREMLLGSVAMISWFVLLQIGTWLNGLSGIIAAYSGKTSPFLYTISILFPPPNGTDSPIVSACLLISGLAILLGLVITLIGLIRKWKSKALPDGV
jgi:hypothetical protein